MAEIEEILLPDVGGEEVEIIELCANVGDFLEEEDAIITVETEKASMDIPALFSGTIVELKVKVGDKISQGSVLCSMQRSNGSKSEEEIPVQKSVEPKSIKIEETMKKEFVKEEASIVKEEKIEVIKKNSSSSLIHASPSVRRLAREFGVDLSLVKNRASGRKNRILIEDVQTYVKQILKNSSNNGETNGSSIGMDLPPLKEIDFSKFGEIELKELTKIQKLSGSNLHRNWVAIPHVTQFDEADITTLEAFRKEQNSVAIKNNLGFKISPLVFILKAVAKALQIHPIFNASLSSDKQSVILKKYIHIAVAVDTPNGLVVPVIRDVDQKGIHQLASELIHISQKARDGKLKIEDMQGACFTISSLGGIAGTAFTPIINAPEVAILGVSKSQIKPMYNGSEFVPKLMLPLSLSYDHRVIDGAIGARFCKTLTQILSDLRLLII